MIKQILLILISLYFFSFSADAKINVPEQVNGRKIRNIEYIYGYEEIPFNEMKKRQFAISKSEYIIVPRNKYEYVCWFKMPFRNTSSDLIEFILAYHSGMIDEIYLYDDQGVLLDSSGDSLPFYKRSVYSRDPAFNILIEPETSKTYFIYAKSKSSFRAGFELYRTFDFYQKEKSEALLFFIFALSTCLCAFYFFYLYIQTKRNPLLIQLDTINYGRIFLFLGIAFFIVIVHGSVFSSFLFPYLWPNHPEINNKLRMIVILGELACAAMMAVSLTSKNQKKNLFISLYLLVFITLIIIFIAAFFNTENYFRVFMAFWCDFGLFFLAPNLLGAFKNMKGKTQIGLKNGTVFVAPALLFFIQSVILILGKTNNYYVNYDYDIFIPVLLFLSVIIATGGVYFSRPGYAKSKYENEYFDALTKAKQIYFEFTQRLMHQLSNPIETLHWSIYNITNALDRLSITRDNKIHTFADKSQFCIQEIQRLVANFKEFSAGKTETIIKTENLNTIIESVMGKIILLNDQPQFQHTIAIEMPDKQLAINCNRVQIEHALYEMIYNAVLYTPPKGKIKIVSIANKKTVNIKIIDNGEGIDKAIGNNLFDIYFVDDLEKKFKDRKSCGLGLPTAKKFIADHKGKLSFISPLNKKEYPDFELDEQNRRGTSFTVNLGLS